jgi:hypothetical protein
VRKYLKGNGDGSKNKVLGSKKLSSLFDLFDSIKEDSFCGQSKMAHFLNICPRALQIYPTLYL